MSKVSHRDSARDRVLCEALVADPDSLVPIPENEFTPHSEAVYRFGSTFQQLAERIAASAHQEAERTGCEDLPWMVVDHGIAVCATGVAKCKFAYQRYLGETRLSGSEIELQTALMNPKTVRFFTFIANMTNAENREFEAHFNLRGNYGRKDYDEFTYDPTEKYFMPNSELYNYAKTGAASARIGAVAQASATNAELSVCPAVHLIPTVWGKVVSACQDAGLLTIE